MKTISSILVIVFSCLLFAQSPVDKGTWNIGGSLSYSSTNSNEEGSYTSELFSFNPTVGYFLIDNFSAGLSVDFEWESIGKFHERDQLQIGPVIRYYFTKNNVIPFLGASYRYSAWYLSKENSPSSSILEFSAGVDYFVTNNVAFEAAINYAIENMSLQPSYYYNEDITNKVFSLAIGLNFFSLLISWI